MKHKILQKIFAIFTSFVLILNSVSPLLQVAYADEISATPTPTVSQDITPAPTDAPAITTEVTPTETPTPIITPDITITPTPTDFASPEPSAETGIPAPTVTEEISPTPTTIVEPTTEPQPALESTILPETPTPTTEPTPTPTPTLSLSSSVWTTNSDSATTTNPVALNFPYVAPQNDKVSVTFTKLPDNPGALTIKEITLTPEQIARTGSLSDKAYDISSDMADGTFAYNLTLPISQSNSPISQNVEIKYAENLDSLSSAQTISEQKQQTSDSITVSDVNHFTIFVVTKNAVTDCLTGAYVDGSCYSTIQAAIDAANPGDTINVAAGTYTEVGQIVIDKNLSIVGADKATTIIKPASAMPGGSSSGGWIRVGNGVTFSLSKVTLDGDGKPMTICIVYAGTTSIDDVIIKNIIGTSRYYAWGIFGNYNQEQPMSLSVTNSTFLNIDRVAIQVERDLGTSIATISNNTFTGQGLGDHLNYAIAVADGSTATITGNTITNFAGTASDGSNSAAILVYTYQNSDTTATTATITGNTITGNYHGIGVGIDDSTDYSVVHAHNNSIFGNSSTTESYSSTIKLDASNNWWGNASGPSGAGTGTGDSVSTNVAFSRWYTNSAMTTLSPASAPTLGTAASFAALGTAVTLTGSTVTGSVGSTGVSVTQTGGTVTGTVYPGADPAVNTARANFLSAYDTVAAMTVDTVTTGTLAGRTLTPGVYSFDISGKTGTLTLDAQGNPDAVWIFKTAVATGYLEATNFNVVFSGNIGNASNVFWWTDAAATATTSNLLGTILSGAAITITGGALNGRALAKADVTVTGPNTTTVPGLTPACTTTCYVNDGTGNDTNSGASADTAKKTIQAAINQVSPDGTVYVAAGTYPEQVTINKSLDLIGDGKTTTTILAPAVRTGSVTQGTIQDYVLAAYAPSSTIDVRVEGFTIDVGSRNKTSGTARIDGVFFRDVKDAGGTMAGFFASTIHNFAATPDYEAWGMAVYGDSLLTINENDISDYTRDGLLVIGGNVTISGNTITGSATPLNGINIQNVTAGTVTGNTVTGHTRSDPWAAGGIVAWTSTGITISNNHVNGNFYGIDLQDNSHDITISGNELTNNIKRGITLDKSDNNTVSSNTINGPAGGTDDVGIGVVNTSAGNMIGGVTLSAGNIITMATSGSANLYAIHMQGDAGINNTIKYNTITGGKRAVQFDGPPGITGLTTVANNTISGQSFGGILAYNNGNLTITDNTLTNAVRPMEFYGPHNLTITGNTINGSTYSGINLGSFSGTANVGSNIIHNIAIDNNGIWAQTNGTGLDITSNTIYGITGSGTGGGRGIQIDASADNVNIDSNEIYNITGFSGIVIDTGATGTKINNNYIHNNEQGVVVNEQTAEFHGNRILNNRWGIDLNSTGTTFVLFNNRIANNTNPADSYNLGLWAGTANAINNWWGTDDPTAVAAGITGITGNVTFTPWFTNVEMTGLHSNVEDIVLTGSPTQGQADMTAGVTDIVLTNDTVLDLNSGINDAVGGNVTIGGSSGSTQDLSSYTNGDISNVNLDLPQTFGDQSVLVTQAVTLQSGTDTEPIILTNSDLGNVSVSIPDGTTILAGSGWDGTIQPPTTASGTGNAPAGFSVGGTVIEVGSPNDTLLFDKPVSIILTGVTGAVGYKPAGSNNWIQITNVCGGTYANPTAPVFPGECYISNGADTTIYTYHFTTFGSLNVASSVSGGASDGKSDGLGCGSHDCSGNAAATSQGQVLGSTAATTQGFASGVSKTTNPEGQNINVTPTQKKAGQVLAGETPAKSSNQSPLRIAIEAIITFFVVGSVGFWLLKKRKKS